MSGEQGKRVSNDGGGIVSGTVCFEVILQEIGFGMRPAGNMAPGHARQAVAKPAWPDIASLSHFHSLQSNQMAIVFFPLFLFLRVFKQRISFEIGLMNDFTLMDQKNSDKIFISHLFKIIIHIKKYYIVKNKNVVAYI